jgi:hypothetical protein
MEFDQITRLKSNRAMLQVQCLVGPYVYEIPSAPEVIQNFGDAR